MFICLTSPDNSVVKTIYFDNHSSFIDWMNLHPGWTWSNCDEPDIDIDID